MKYATREYYCPTCGNKEKHGTNHQGEIYCNCKNCGNSPLYCAEVDAHAGQPFATAIIHFYNYDMECPSAKEAYAALREKLKDIKCFEVNGDFQAWNAMRKHEGKRVKLFNPDT